MTEYRINPGDLQALESLLDTSNASYEDFEDYYPASARGDLEEEAEQYPDTVYVARNVVWLGTEGKMLRVDPDYAYHIQGNIFDSDKLGAVVEGVVHHPTKVHFYAPYGTASKIDVNDVRESLQYEDDDPLSTGDDDLDEYLLDPDAFLEEYEEDRDEMEQALVEAEEEGSGDLGSWTFTFRDGNHRAFGSLLADEPYVWAILEDNQYQDLVEAKKRGTMTEEQKELWEMLL